MLVEHKQRRPRDVLLDDSRHARQAFPLMAFVQWMCVKHHRKKSPSLDVFMYKLAL